MSTSSCRTSTGGGRLLLAAVLVTAAITSGCSFFGADPRDHGQIAIAVHPGYSGTAMKEELTSLIQAAGNDGAMVQVWALGPSAATMSETQFDLAGAGRNDGDRAEESGALTKDAQGKVTAQLDQLAGGDGAGGADLIGALRRIVQQASAMKGRGPRRAVLLAGGGAHRTADFDLTSPDAAQKQAAVIRALLESLSGSEQVAVEIYGVGDFGSLGSTPDGAFVTRVNEFWKALCLAVDQTDALSCRLA